MRKKIDTIQMIRFKYALTSILLALTAIQAISENEKIIELSTNNTILYPSRMGLSENESLLTLFQSLPSLMSSEENEISENVSVSIDGGEKIYDANAVLRRLKVMDVESIEIKNINDAGGTAGLGASVSIKLRKEAEGLHGDFSVDGSTNGTLDPTASISWKKDKISIKAGASLYLDHSITKTKIKETNIADGRDSTTNKTETENTYEENAYLTIKYKITDKDKLKLSMEQEHLKVESEEKIKTTSATDKTKEENKQNCNKVSLDYEHQFTEKAQLKVKGSADFQNNPHLYDYKYADVMSSTTNHANTKSWTRKYAATAEQTLPLWKGAGMTISEKLEWKDIDDLTSIVTSDGMSNYYDITSLNSQTAMQIDWRTGKWTFQAGEVIDYFRYEIGFTQLRNKTNDNTTPQTYALVNYNINSKNDVYIGYRTCLTRPGYKQIYPITTTIDAENNYVRQDSLFRALNNSKGHMFNLGHIFNNNNNVAVSSTFKAIFVNDILSKDGDTWSNCAKNNFYRLNCQVVLYSDFMTNTFGIAGNMLSYKDKDADPFENKLGYDLRWMGTAKLGKGWLIGASFQYYGPQWSSNIKIDNYATAVLHASKSVGNWTFTANFEDIFDAEVVEMKTSSKSKKVTRYDLDWQGLSIGATYKF